MATPATVTFNPLDPLGLFSQTQSATGAQVPFYVFDPLGLFPQTQSQTGLVLPFSPQIVPPTNMVQCQQQQAASQVGATNFLLPSPADTPTYLINTVNQILQQPENMISGAQQQTANGLVGIMSSVRQGVMSMVSAPEQQRQAMTAQFSSPFATPTVPCQLPQPQSQQQSQSTATPVAGERPGETTGINWVFN